MKRSLHWFRVVLTLALLLSAFGGAQRAQAAPKADEDVDAAIANAESAALVAHNEPPPLSDNVTVVHEELNYPRGLIFDADGNLYVVEAGRGGDTEVTAATCPDFVSPFMPYHVGMSGRVAKITPDGERSTAVEGLPSARDPFDWVIGPNAVTILDGELYVLQGAGGCSRALDDIPNGIVRSNADGTWETVVDLSEFWRAQWDPANLTDDDIEPDGEAYGLIAVDDLFYVVETNQGALLQATSDGKIERLVDFQADYGAIAPSVVAAYDGDLYVGNIGDFPTEAGAAKVFKVAMDGAVEVYAEGLTNILGLEFDDAGNLYVLQMSDGSAELPGPGMGNIVRIDNAGEQAVIASGLTAPAGLTWGPDGALYVSLFGYDMEPGLPSAEMGQIVRVDIDYEMGQQDTRNIAIANAESAAPSAIAHDATIIDWDEGGLPTVVLREGTNGWVCLTDWPVSPGDDPACYDAVFNAWNNAMMAGEEPEIDGTGIAYMLAGGSDPSNTDPFAVEPAEGEEWISTPPHIMIITPAGFDAGDYANEPKQDEPYIMWDDTPYEHLMVPVAPTPDDLLGDMDEITANTMRSSPAGVALNATIMGYPEQEGGDMRVMQEGTNGWTCWPDNLTSPGNDPSCQDAMMEAFWSIGDTQAVERVGLSYMLQGGSDPSNDDPNLSTPREGEEWVATPPHVMLVIPGGFDEGHFTTDHMSGYPYVMFSETGYEHIMIPVADMLEMEHGENQSVDIEQMKAEALAQELNTFDLMIAGDWEGYDAVTDPNFYQIGPDGAYIERDAMLAGLMDEKLVVRAPELGEMRVEMITPDAYMVTYPLNFNGAYDGHDFSNARTVTSLWVQSDGKWQNSFLVEQIRTAPLYATENMSPTVMLPNGFEPEGITIGRDATAYVGSVGSGSIYKVNLATGEGNIFVPAHETQRVAGMVYDQRTDLLYVAGIESGNGLVYDGLTGEQVAEAQFTSVANGLVNDAALADDAIYFTDSYLPVVYRLPLDPESHLPDPAASETISLTGDFENLPDGLNSNGIVASADGAKLIVAHSDLGKLYMVDAASGEATELALDSEVQPYHDGLALDGDTLYVVDSTVNQDNVYVVELDPEWKSGKVVRTITDPTMDALTTAAIYADVLYVVNARWDAERTPETEYWLTKLTR